MVMGNPRSASREAGICAFLGNRRWRPGRVLFDHLTKLSVPHGGCPKDPSGVGFDTMTGKGG